MSTLKSSLPKARKRNSKPRYSEGLIQQSGHYIRLGFCISRMQYIRETTHKLARK